MPYIPQKDREELISGDRIATNAGELNYVITVAVTNYLAENGEGYQAFNDCIGALEGAKLELYRRVVANYENKKIEENGDVY